MGKGREGRNRCRGRGETRVKKTLPIICCTNARAKLLVFNLASPRVIGWKWGRGKKKREKEKNVILSLSLSFSYSLSFFPFSVEIFPNQTMDGRQKINPLSLNYILLPFLILSDIRPVGSDLNTLSEKSNLSMED